MNYKLIYTESYLKRERKFFRRHPELLGQYEKTLMLLELNPHHPSLRLHQLSGKLDQLYSVSINMSYRLVMEFLILDRELVLVDVGDHDRVYR